MVKPLQSSQWRLKFLVGLVMCAGMTISALMVLENASIVNDQMKYDTLTKTVQQQHFSKLNGQKYVLAHKNYEFDAISSAQMRNLQSELELRRKRLKRYCPLIHEEEFSFQTTVRKLIVDTIHGITWCPIYKAGSSTWMENFAVLGGILSDSTIDLIRRNVLQVNSIVRQAFPNFGVNKTLEQIRRTRKFLIVRHPFERLLSAYRDKLEHIEGREYYYTRFGRQITRQYRQKGNSTNTRIEPTFAEFLKFITEEKYYDEHWMPYIQACSPCTIEYDYILKFETFKRDEDFLIKELKLNEYLYTNSNIKNINPRGPTTFNIARDYFKHVPRALLISVYKIYENDFKLFNYFPTDYYYMTQL